MTYSRYLAVLTGLFLLAGDLVFEELVLDAGALALVFLAAGPWLSQPISMR